MTMNATHEIFSGLRFYRSLLQAPGPQNQQKEAHNDYERVQSLHPAFEAGVQFTKQHGALKPQQHAGSLGQNRRNPEQTFVRLPAAAAAQVQPSPLFQQWPQTAQTCVQQQQQVFLPMPQQQEHQQPAQLTSPLQDIGNRGAHGWQPTPVHGVPAQPHCGQQQLPVATPPVAAATSRQHEGSNVQARFQGQHQPQTLSHQGDSFEDYELDDSILAAVDDFCSQQQHKQAAPDHPQRPQQHVQTGHVDQLGAACKLQQQERSEVALQHGPAQQQQQQGRETLPMPAMPTAWGQPGFDGSKQSAIHKQHTHQQNSVPGLQQQLPSMKRPVPAQQQQRKQTTPPLPSKPADWKQASCEGPHAQGVGRQQLRQQTGLAGFQHQHHQQPQPQAPCVAQQYVATQRQCQLTPPLTAHATQQQQGLWTPVDCLGMRQQDSIQQRTPATAYTQHTPHEADKQRQQQQTQAYMLQCIGGQAIHQQCQAPGTGSRQQQYAAGLQHHQHPSHWLHQGPAFRGATEQQQQQQDVARPTAPYIPAAPRFAQNSEEQEQPVEGWQGFAHQQRQQRQQQRDEASYQHVRSHCAKLLHKLSLFVGDDSAEAAVSGLAAVDAGAGKTAGNNRRWQWLAAERRDAQGRTPGSPGYDPSTLHIPPAAFAGMTEFNKQFWSIKSKCMDMVLFVRHGSFYNLFDVDADVGLRVGLNISGVMTANMWKVGCHKDYFAVWCAKVLAQGYSVGRVEEMPSKSNGSKLLLRQLVRIYTPGTAVEGLLADDLDHKAHTIMCITEMPLSSDSTNSRRTPAQGLSAMITDSSNSAGTVIGLCVLDVSSGSCQAGAFGTAHDPARSALAAALLMYDPMECIAVRNSLQSATVALVTRHCEFKGAAQGLNVDNGITVNTGSAGKHVPGLSWLPPAATAAVLQEPSQLLQQMLPDPALQQLQSVVAVGNNNSTGVTESSGVQMRAVLSAVAVAVKQLQRCSLSEDLLPSLEITHLEGLTKSPALNPGGPMLLDDKAIITLDLLTDSSSGAVPGPTKKATASAAGPSRSPARCLLEYLDRAASAAGRRTLQQWICRPLTVASAIEERLDVLDLFLALPEAATALQQRIAPLPDADRLLPKAAAALRTLQHQQQQQEEQHVASYQQEQPACDLFGPAAGVVDPADNVALEAKRAAWKALLNLPACLYELVKALAQLRGDALHHVSDTQQLPMLHRAFIAASRASKPVKALEALFRGAQMSEQPTTNSSRKPPAADPATGSSNRAAAGIRLAPGAYAAYDEALQQLHQVQEEYQQELQGTLAAYRGSSSSSSVHQVILGDQDQGVLCLVVQPPAGAAPAHQGFGVSSPIHQQSTPPAWTQQLLLDVSHQVIKHEQLADSEVASLVDCAAVQPTAAAGRGRGAKGRGRGASSRGRGRTAAAGAAAGGTSGHVIVNIHIPLLQELAADIQQAQQQLDLAIATALNYAASVFIDSYSLFRSLLKAVSELDVLAGFASVVQPGNEAAGCCFCRPRFASAGAASAAVNGQEAGPLSPILQLQGLWHPLLAASAVAGPGANMGGKSTLLRSTCTAVIMAQIGCYVPARTAVLEPVDAIYTRIGAADAIMCGLSTFMVEMSETAACLAAATPASLIVLDELGRGTSTHDGYALAYAVLKHLAAPAPPTKQHSSHTGPGSAANTIAAANPTGRPRLLFATHYHNLTCERDLVPYVQSHHMATQFDAAVGHLVHLYQLRAGAATAGSCGIEVAALAGLPSSVVQRATQVAAAMQLRYRIQV